MAFLLLLWKWDTLCLHKFDHALTLTLTIDIWRRKNPVFLLLVSSHVTPYGDLSSLFAGEDSFNRFTADMVRQIMKEEEYRSQHQAALLNLREKALKEKAKAELSWLKQLKQQPRDKRADDMFPNLDKKERHIRKNLEVQQVNEIDDQKVHVALLM